MTDKQSLLRARREVLQDIAATKARIRELEEVNAAAEGWSAAVAARHEEIHDLRVRLRLLEQQADPVGF